jgi:hypothetical protein
MARSRNLGHPKTKQSVGDRTNTIDSLNSIIVSTLLLATPPSDQLHSKAETYATCDRVEIRSSMQLITGQR